MLQCILGIREKNVFGLAWSRPCTDLGQTVFRATTDLCQISSRSVDIWENGGRQNLLSTRIEDGHCLLGVTVNNGALVVADTLTIASLRARCAESGRSFRWAASRNSPTTSSCPACRSWSGASGRPNIRSATSASCCPANTATPRRNVSTAPSCCVPPAFRCTNRQRYDHGGVLNRGGASVLGGVTATGIHLGLSDFV